MSADGREEKKFQLIDADGGTRIHENFKLNFHEVSCYMDLHKSFAISTESRRIELIKLLSSLHSCVCRKKVSFSALTIAFSFQRSVFRRTGQVENY